MDQDGFRTTPHGAPATGSACQGRPNWQQPETQIVHSLRENGRTWASRRPKANDWQTFDARKMPERAQPITGYCRERRFSELTRPGNTRLFDWITISAASAWAWERAESETKSAMVESPLHDLRRRFHGLLERTMARADRSSLNGQRSSNRTAPRVMRIHVNVGLCAEIIDCRPKSGPPRLTPCTFRWDRSKRRAHCCRRLENPSEHREARRWSAK